MPLKDGRHPSWPPHHQGSLIILCLRILYQSDQATHLSTTLAWIHYMGQDMAVERIDTTRCSPGIECEIVCLARSQSQCISLDWFQLGGKLTPLHFFLAFFCGCGPVQLLQIVSNALLV
jgi:hypothetical protein